ncbi:MAG: 2,3-bisphosphoglycerate-independent phosphoglycerate mutase [Planctomycetota bacterium]|jgi:2,3-bisphosphoglycerate-independent phosphoglycerate mutase
MTPKRPTLLIVLDGWGHAPATDFNAITHAPAEHFLSWWQEWPHALLSASGKEVGLPLGLMGNSEVGHTNIGAGRRVYQTISRIDASIESGEFQRIGVLREAVETARAGGGKLHLFGLLGGGGVHAMDAHLEALIALACDMGMQGERIVVHALLDGRDTPPSSAADFATRLEPILTQHGARFATLCGRYFGMDRDRNWERTKLYWDLMVHGQAEHQAPDASSAIREAYSRGETDEFVKPIQVGPPALIQDGDSVLSFNFRADRVRQITEAFLGDEQFQGFARGAVPQVRYTSMTQYSKEYSCAVAYPPEELHSLFGELVAEKGLRQFRCAETEKYAHVTFFFNGGREAVYAGEERHLVPSPKVATYDLKPEMSAFEVTAAVLDRLQKGEDDLYVINFANSDMVGHTGIESAAEAAVRAVDGCLKQIVDLALEKGGTVAITADHGNAEQMKDPVSGETHTAHTVNPVPFLLIGEATRGTRLRPQGVLADVAPTLMETMDIDQPDVMDGHSLLHT